MGLAGIPIRQGLNVDKAIVSDPKEIVGDYGAVAFVGIDYEDPRWVCIIISLASSSKSDLHAQVVGEWSCATLPAEVNLT